MSVLLAHPTGNAFVRALLCGLVASDRLAGFATSLDATLLAKARGWIPERWGAEIARRAFPEAPGTRVQGLLPIREVARLLLPRLGWAGPLRHETGWASVDAVYRAFDRAVADSLDHWPQARVVYAYEDAARDSFRAARARGWHCVYDLPIAHWQTVQWWLREEIDRHPDWVGTVPGALDSPAKLARKDEELSLADRVIVPSRFVMDSLPEEVRRRTPCLVAPFGSPPASAHPPTPPAPGQPLRLLFAGSLTLRKGLPDLFAALRSLQRRDVELVAAGSLAAPLEFYTKRCPGLRWEPPRPHAAFLDLMSTCHALVLPSLVEGRALVQQEAMARGLPLLVTPNAGGEDLILEGQTGFLIPPRRPDLLAERIAWLADHRQSLPEMSRAAQDKAGQYTWEGYSDAILAALPTLP